VARLPRPDREGARRRAGNHQVNPFSYAKKGRVKFERVDLRNFVSDGTPIPDAVSFRLDVPAFLNTLSDRQQRMAEDLMTGTSTKECAEKFKVSAAAISQFRVRFKELFDLYMAS
jgi:hypothetical protein